MSGDIVQLTDASFDELVLKNQQGAVLVDFWAHWCGPCKAIAPVLEAIALEYQGRVTVAKLDVDAHSATASKYHIRTIPALLLFKNGVVVATKLGAVSKGELASFLNGNL